MFNLLAFLPATAFSQQVITQTFTSTGTFIVHAGVTRVNVQAWGAGGGGGGADSFKAKNRAGGGGAGAAGLTGLAPGTWGAGNSATEVGGGGSGGWDNLADNNAGDGAIGGNGFRGQVVVSYTLSGPKRK